MSEQPQTSPRTIPVADHLWEVLGLMAREMASDRASLVNQALFVFARQHGYLQPGRAVPAEGAPEPQLPTAPAPEEPTPPPHSGPPAFVQDDRPSEPPFAAPLPDVASLPEDAAELPENEARAAHERVLEEVIGEFQPLSTPPSAVPAEPAPPLEAGPDTTLALFFEGREQGRVLGPRFLIGRGRHCDLIIPSGKISREHAAIVRDGDDYFIEDLGSSNGTWFDKTRIERRRIEDGDDYFVSFEKLTCRFVPRSPA